MLLASGTKLGPYEIVGPLGAGGMSEVYRARDTRLGRDVAVKILPKEMSADPQRKQRFEREAKTISSLNHPNICTLHDIGSQDGVDYLVEGENCRRCMLPGRPTLLRWETSPSSYSSPLETLIVLPPASLRRPGSDWRRRKGNRR